MTAMQARSAKRHAKIQKVAANLFLKRGYDGVSVDQIVQLAGGSKSTVYSVFGGKCGLFIQSVENLCKEFTSPLEGIDYTGLSLKECLLKLGQHIVKHITARRAVELHRLVIAEAGHCPEVGHAWYVHGPTRTTAYIARVFASHREQLKVNEIALEQAAVIFHDALVCNIQHRLLTGVETKIDETQIPPLVSETVELFLNGYYR